MHFNVLNIMPNIHIPLFNMHNMPKNILGIYFSHKNAFSIAQNTTLWARGGTLYSFVFHPQINAPLIFVTPYTLCLSNCPYFCAGKIALLMPGPPPFASKQPSSAWSTSMQARSACRSTLVIGTNVVVRARPIVDWTPMHARHASAQHACRLFNHWDCALVPRARSITRVWYCPRANGRATALSRWSLLGTTPPA
jgi:hypothetical protein